LTPLAAEVISYGTYAERSPSSEGIRMFVSDDTARTLRALHPAARYQHGTLAWRISPEDLGRPGLEEDLSYHPTGISD
jgi:hypothetical protein